MKCFVLLSIGLPLLSWSSIRQTDQIILMPVEGKMMVNAVVPLLDRQVFGLGIPETIGCEEQMMLVNHSDTEIRWKVNEADGSVSTNWEKEGVIYFHLKITPAEDYVDLVLTVENQSSATWHSVFAFNCISPARAAGFRDSSLTRTYLSIDQKAVPLGNLPRKKGPRPTVGVYPIMNHNRRLPAFAQAFEATNSQSDGSWMVVLSNTEDAYMATVTDEAAFLFNNTKFGCIHAAPFLEDINPHEKVTVSNRVYFSKGGLLDFLERYDSYQKSRVN